MLVDESKGTGVLPKTQPKPSDGYNIGYVSGIGPANIKYVLQKVLTWRAALGALKMAPMCLTWICAMNA
eukprot:1603316-Ditylum_brightwellii.AAC.1